MSDKVTYSKLRSGGWGVRGPASMLSPNVGVIVHKKDGTTKRETVRNIIWTDGKVALAALQRTFHRRSRSTACYMCGSYTCEGAFGGLCEED